VQLGLGLIQDDRADEAGVELDGEEADLLAIGRDVVRQDLELASSERRL